MQTNADRIRSMSDEELAKWFALDNGLKSCPKGARWPKSCECGCGNCWLDWLRQDAESYSEEDIADQEYQAAVAYQEYCERYEPTYNTEDGSM